MSVGEHAAVVLCVMNHDGLAGELLRQVGAPPPPPFFFPLAPRPPFFTLPFLPPPEDLRPLPPPRDLPEESPLPRTAASTPSRSSIKSYLPSLVVLTCLSLHPCCLARYFSIFLLMEEFQWFLMALSVLRARRFEGEEETNDKGA